MSPRRSDPVPTLVDVARYANVSTATVSRCLNSPDQVVEKTRVKVLKAIQELGYSPNFGARALAAKRTNTIGAIIPTMDNAIFAKGLQAFQEELGNHGQTLLVASSSYRPELEEKQIRNLTARGADALLLVGFDRTQAIYDFLASRSMSVLIAWAYRPDGPHLSIGFDNRSAMQELTQTILELGHRRIACISAPQAGNDRARERILGIGAAIKTHGADAAIKLVETPYSIDNGKTAFRQLMTGSAPPTVVICGNDVLAVGALHMAKTMGLRVPLDVSITGFDDMELAQVADPALTTVQVPHGEMGRRAAQMLVEMVRGGAAPQSVRLDTKIQYRDTLASPSSQ